MSPCNALNVCTPAGPVTPTVRRPVPLFVTLISFSVAVKLCEPDAFTASGTAPLFVMSMPPPVTVIVSAVTPL